MKKDDKGGISSFNVGFGSGNSRPRAIDEPALETVNDRGGASCLRILVVSDLTPGPDYSTGTSPTLEAANVDGGALDSLMESLAPTFVLEVEDPFAKNSPVRLDLRLRSLKDFRPGALVEQCAMLRCWSDTARLLRQVERNEVTPDAARQQLERILPRPQWQDAVGRALTQSRSAAAGKPAPTPTPSKSSASKSSGSALDSILSKVALPDGASSSDSSQPAVSGLVDAVVRSGSSSRTTSTEVSEPLSVAKKALGSLLSSLLTHPEFQRIERSWRGLRLLLDHATRRSDVYVEVIAAGSDRVAPALERVAQRGHSSGEKLAPDLILVDAEVTPTARDLDQLTEWGELAGKVPAPLVLGGTPELLGFESIADLGRTTSRVSASDDPRVLKLKAVSAREATRWVCVALNGPVGRDPYTKSTSRLREMDFAEDPTSPPFFLNPAFLVGAIVSSAFAQNGHPFSCLGPRDGRLDGLPLHHLKSEDVSIPLEAPVTTEAQDEAATCGVTLLTSQLNRDTAVMAKAPVLYRGESVARIGDSPPAQSLPDQLFVARTAHTVELIAGAIPRNTDESAVAEVATIVLADLFPKAGPSGPEASVRVEGDILRVTVRPHRYGQIRTEEVTFSARIG